MSQFKIDGAGNEMHVGDNVELTGSIIGSGNYLKIDNALHGCKLEVRISGDNNRVVIDSPFAVKGLQIRVGSHVKANRVTLEVGEGFSIEGAGQFLLYNSGNTLVIGKNCMFSNNITIRCGDSPHLLFDLESGDYLDVSEGVFIGDHVWVGERAYVTKKATIPAECLVAACAVVSRRFEESNAVIAGNPGRVVRHGVQWIRNRSLLETGSKFKNSYDEYINKYI